MKRRSVGGIRARFEGLSSRDKRALGLGALIVLPVLLWMGVARPYLTAVQELKDRTASELSLLERERQVLADSSSYARELSAATKAMGHWEARLIRSPNLALAEAQISSVLERIGRESRVLLQEVQAAPAPPGAVAPPEGLQQLRMSASGEGDFEGVLSFLRGIEAERLLLRVIGVSVDRAGAQTGTAANGGGGGPVALSFVVVLEAYAPADAELAGSPDDAGLSGGSSTEPGGG